MDERAHTLIDRIYAAAVDHAVWQQVAEHLSACFEDSPLVLALGVPIETGPPLFAVGIDDAHRDSYLENLFKGFPASPMRHADEYGDRWGRLNEFLPGVELTDTGFYRDWMKPQGLAAHWPVGHTMLDSSGLPCGGIGVLRREGQEALSSAQLAEANVFVPHLRRALEVQLTLHGAQRVRLALAEAIDRLPTGLVLLDAQRRVVILNRGAERIAAEKDGLRIDPLHGPIADDARANATLQALIADALDASKMGDLGAPGFIGIRRASGKRSYALMVTPLVPERTPGVSGEAVVAIFFADPSARLPTGAQVLEDLYGFTHSEAELVRLLSTGISLEEAAHTRGVSLNTARSHLKHAFSKTGTSRQGELVRLIVTGVGQIRER